MSWSVFLDPAISILHYYDTLVASFCKAEKVSGLQGCYKSSCLVKSWIYHLPPILLVVDRKLYVVE